jgi:hypothetical protein
MVYHKDKIQNVNPLSNIPKAYLFKALQIIKANSHGGSVMKITSIDCEKINHYIPPTKSIIIKSPFYVVQ